MTTISGSLIKGYELKERIGAGGFGAVYRARQSTVGREVAVKVILPGYANQPDFIRRFETEAQVVAHLEHMHIVPLYDYWRDPEGAFLVMRLLRGGSLQVGLQKGPYDLEAAATLLSQVASGLALAHRNQIIHRDIKPSNILLDEDGNAYLTDFGIAKVLNTGASMMTDGGGIVGSPDYLAPEQARSEPITPQTDIYSMGIVLYEMLTGEHPFKESSTIERLFHHLNDPVPMIAGMAPDVTEGINRVIQKATAKNPKERYRDILQLANEFRDAAGLSASRAGGSIVEMLSPREQEVLYLLTEGRGNREIAEELGIENTTVKWYIQQIYKKLNVRSRAQAIVKARELNLIVDAFKENAAGTVGISAAENPYKGLRAFQAVDEADFHGRDRLVRKLLKRLGQEDEYCRFLAVVGPSGSGKSSLVRAGLVPALWRGELPDSDRWFVVEMIPGPSPLEELETALIRIAAEQGGNIGEYLRRNENGLLRIPGLILPDDGSELVVVIDQFEEVFTLVEDEDDRLHFLDLLARAVTDNRSRVRVIVTLRADFYDRPLGYAEFGTLMQNRVETVLPLTADELEQAIVQPARRVGVLFEDGLVQKIIDEMLYQPGMLPLLQYALTELFEVREDRQLTHAGYQQIGGALGALGKRAEEIYLEQDEAGQALVRQIFLRLVTLGEGAEDTRRRAPHVELVAVAPDPDSADEIIETFARYRLFSLDHDPETRVPTVEVAHEAILKEWERLRGWLDRSREDIRQQRRLARDARDWAFSSREPSFLLRGARLESVRAWRAATDLSLTRQEADFLEASVLAWKNEIAAEEARAEREQRLERRSRNVLRALVVVFAAATIAALFLSNFAFQQRGIAVENAATAQFEAGARATQQAIAEEAQSEAFAQAELAAANEAEAISQKTIVEEQALAAARLAEINHSRFLAAQSQLALQGNNTGLALALAMQAVQIEDPPQEAELALSEAAYTEGTYRLFTGHAADIFAVWLSPDGQTLMSYSIDRTLRTWDVRSGEQVRSLDLSQLELPDHEFAQRAVVFSPDGKRLLVALKDMHIAIIDTATGETIRTLAGHDSPILKLAISPDGRRALSGGGLIERTVEPSPESDLSVRLWDLDTGEELLRLEGHTHAVFELAFGPDGRTAISGSWDGSLIQWDLETGAILQRLENQTNPAVFFQGDVYSLAVSADGRLAITNSDFDVNLWDLEAGQLIRKLARMNAVSYNAAISPDALLGAVGTFGGEIRIWDLVTGAEKLALSGGSWIRGLVFGPDGDRLYAGVGEKLQIWSIHNGAQISRSESPGSKLYGILYSPDGKSALYVDQSPDGSTTWLVVLDLATGDIARRIELPGQGWWTAYHPDGKSVFVTFLYGTVIRYDLASGEEIGRLYMENVDRVNTVAVSPDGRSVVTGAQGNGTKLVRWDLETGEQLMTFDTADVIDVAISPDGKTALSGGVDNKMTLWDLETGKALHVFEGHGGFVWEVAFSPDGKRALTASWDSTLILWDLETGEIIHRLLGHTDIVRGVAFHPDGKTAISGSRDGSLILWDLESGKAIRRYRGHSGAVNGVAFSPDGSNVLSIGDDGLLIRWRIDDTLERLVAWTQANRYLPELSCEERSLFDIEPLCAEQGAQDPLSRICVWKEDSNGLASEEFCTLRRWANP